MNTASGREIATRPSSFKFLIIVALFFGLAGTARAQLAQTTVTGLVGNTLTGELVANAEVVLYEVRKTGAIIPTGVIRFKTDAQGRLLDEHGNVGIKVPRNSQIRVFSTAPGFNSCREFQPCSASAANGVWLPVPDAETATLEGIASVPSVPSVGMVIQSNDSPLTNKEGTLNFKSGIKATQTSAGVAKVELDASGVTAGPCTSCDLTIDATGRITAKASGAGGGSGAWDDITGKPSTFAPSAHASTHAAAGGDALTLSESQVTGLAADLAGKASASHTHTASAITDFNSAVDARVPVASVFGRTGTVVAASGDYSFAQIGSTPTTLSGYGITDAQAHSSNLDSWSSKTAYAGSLTITTGKTANVTNSLTFSGIDGSTLNVGAGGTLGTAAFTAASAYEVPLTFSAPLMRTVNTVTIPPTATPQFTALGIGTAAPASGIKIAGATGHPDFLSGYDDPRQYITLYDDFLGGAVGNLNWTLAGGSFSGASDAYGQGDISGSSSGSGAGIDLNLAGSTARIANYGALTFDTFIRARISSTSLASYFLGMNKLDAYGEGSSDYIAIAYDTAAGDTNFVGVVKTGGTATRTSLGVVADTSMHTFRIRSTTPGTILFSVDGGSEVSISANVPTGYLAPILCLIPREDANKILSVDYFKQRIAVSR